MKFRKLRIAWSVFWGVACVLLIALWVRSYWREDLLCIGGLPLSKSVHVLHSDWGTIGTANMMSSFAADKGRWLFTHRHLPGRPRRRYTFLGVGYIPPPFGAIHVADWLPILLFVSLAAGPWLRYGSKRFSLRTLLIATTLVAVVLGAIVYAMR